MANHTKTSAWQLLAQHQKEMALCHMRDLFALDEKRSEQLQLHFQGLTLDYSKNILSEHTLELLVNLARASHLPEQIKQLFTGVPINTTENRAVLHTALRNNNSCSILLNGSNICDVVANTRARLDAFVADIHSGKLTGVNGHAFKYIVNIGIGGSYTGPMMATDALKDYALTDLEFLFISSVDQCHLQEVLNKIDPETTLFIISSKSFTTIETLTNAQTIIQWVEKKLGKSALKFHFAAVTSAKDKANSLGIESELIFPVWEWVGGRYSLWSAIGLPLMLQIGSAQFAEFLAGAHAMDEHFYHADFAENMPVLLALISIWYINFFDASAHAIIPYAHRLRFLIPYLQQMDMESNGKRTTTAGEIVSYNTGPILFGEEGVIGQHAYHQLLHQGQHFIPADFILVKEAPTNDLPAIHHQLLLASALSQSQALMQGKTKTEVEIELASKNYSKEKLANLAQHKEIPGNKPSNIIYLQSLTPYNLGSLISLYEHKVFVQGVIWDINSFDQWGVELGKQLLPDILQKISETV